MKSPPIPTLTQYFSPDWIIERSKCNDYSKLVTNQFSELIENEEHSCINSIAMSLRPITSNDIEYPERQKLSTLIIDFVLTLKEKNLLPCIIFSDNRLLCEAMADSIAKHFEDLEENLRTTKYKNQIESLRKRIELKEKEKVRKPPKTSKKRNQDDNVSELAIAEEELQNHMVLSGHEQQLLDGILDEATLSNRQGCDQDVVDTLLKRAAFENRRLVEYIRRGVAYHHSGLNSKGRVAVEALFRNRFIQVVCSTATLGRAR